MEEFYRARFFGEAFETEKLKTLPFGEFLYETFMSSVESLKRGEQGSDWRLEWLKFLEYNYFQGLFWRGFTLCGTTISDYCRNQLCFTQNGVVCWGCRMAEIVACGKSGLYDFLSFSGIRVVEAEELTIFWLVPLTQWYWLQMASLVVRS